MNEVLEKLSKIGIIPVIALNDSEDAAPVARALLDGGLPCAEVTFRTEAAEEAIRIMTKEYPYMLVGAGTVLTTEQVDRAIAAGAKFIVSPGLNPKVVCHCIEKGIPITPGCNNPSDMEQAIELGLKVVKFFPAEASGGIDMIKSLAAPYSQLKFIPTGGISIKNLNNYLDFKKVIACGGSWIVNNELVKNRDFNKITLLAKEAVSAVLGFELAHVGINANEEAEADSFASTLVKMFGFQKIAGNSSIFAGSGFEIMKSQKPGTVGHIALRTNNIHRAIHYLETNGFEFDMDSKKYDDHHNLKAIYLIQKLGGFAIHLVQK